MLEDDPFEAVDPQQLEELSEAVRHEESEAAEQSAIPTLAAIVDELADEIEQRTLVGVIVLDASNLGGWEREHGAAAFDRVIQRLARAVEQLRGEAIRADDRLCTERAGGDGLLVFLSRPRADRPQERAVEFEEVVTRIKRMLVDTPHDAQLSTHAAFEKIAAGSALIIRNSSVDPRREIYRAIRRARSTARTNYLEMQRRRHRVIGQMIAHRKIHTLYQPIVDLRADRIIGYEALSRADKPDSEQLGVHLFVAAARAELDGELDQTCRKLSVRRRPELHGSDRLFINCLPPTFYEPMDELELLIDLWRDDGLAPEQLVFEVTENITYQQAQRILPSVRKLRRRGFKFALDDMGTGTTNLRLVSDLQPDYIKMDIALTRGVADSPQKQKLARYLLELADHCDAELIAEGIEDAADAGVLKEIGVRYGQGFYLGRPKSRDELTGRVGSA